MYFSSKKPLVPDKLEMEDLLNSFFQLFYIYVSEHNTDGINLRMLVVNDARLENFFIYFDYEMTMTIFTSLLHFCKFIS